MSRAIIGGFIAAIIVALTVTVQVVTSSKLEGKIRGDLTTRIQKAQESLIQNAAIQAIALRDRVAKAARNTEYVRVVQADSRTEKADIANLAFGAYKNAGRQGAPQPIVMTIVDIKGDVVAELDERNPVASKWKDKAGKLRYPALTLALTQDRAQVTSEVWRDPQLGLLRVGVAPVLDPGEETGKQVIGALVIGYGITFGDARNRGELLRGDVAYFYGDDVFATSFTRGGKEDQEKRGKFVAALKKSGLAKEAVASKGLTDKVRTLSVGGESYLVAAGVLPRASVPKFPASYAPVASGAVVMMSLSDALAPVGSVKILIWLLGAAALIISQLGMALVSKRLIHQVDQLEVGVNEIINGNLDKTFQPVGSELDGLASAINVMLARLLGRPEPGEEEYDDDGNLITGATLQFDSEGLSAADEEIVALAQEPEPNYYARIYNEYVAARQQVGEAAEGITFEGFVTNLRVNEGNLKGRYKCSAVRFKVVVKDGKVILKPVPIV